MWQYLFVAMDLGTAACARYAGVPTTRSLTKQHLFVAIDLGTAACQDMSKPVLRAVEATLPLP